MKHELKTEREFFAESWLGSKSFEIRVNDRNFRKGDDVELLEWSVLDDYTGREIHGTISYITDFGQMEGFVVFQLTNISQHQE